MFRAMSTGAVIVFSVCFAIAQSAPAPSATPKSDADALPAGPGKDLVQKSCATCHSLHNITAKRATEKEWSNTVDQMIDHGAVLSDADADTITHYLATNFGPASGAPPAPVGAPPASTSH